MVIDIIQFKVRWSTRPLKVEQWKKIVPFEPERTCQHITTKENEGYGYFSFSFNSMFFRETVPR